MSCKKATYERKHQGGPVDGVFGRKTAAGVKAYQRDVGLKVDGVVGKHTWARMFA